MILSLILASIRFALLCVGGWPPLQHFSTWLQRCFLAALLTFRPAVTSFLYSTDHSQWHWICLQYFRMRTTSSSVPVIKKVTDTCYHAGCGSGEGAVLQGVQINTNHDWPHRSTATCSSWGGSVSSSYAADFIYYQLAEARVLSSSVWEVKYQGMQAAE